MSVDVRIKYQYTKGISTFKGDGTVHVSNKSPTESEVLAAFKRKHPEAKDIVILEIK